MPTKTFARRAASLALLLSLIGAALSPADAQDEGNGRATREREALRRTQAALRAAQEQQSTLEREKAALAAQSGAIEESARRAQAQLASLKAEAGRDHGELARARAERTALLEQLDAVKRAAETRQLDDAKKLAEASRRLDETIRLLAERTATVESLAALQERTHQALATAEAQNRELYGFGRRLVEQLRSGTGTDAFMASEPVLAFGRVRLENNAEQLRDRLEALRLKTSAK